MGAPESIKRIVTNFACLKQLTLHAQRLQGLNRLVAETLPQRLAAHVELATVRDGCLVLRASSPAWAAEIRYKTPEILAALSDRAEFAGICSVRVRTDLDAPQPILPTRKATMSAHSAASIAAQAATVEDAAVRGALMRLARRGKD